MNDREPTLQLSRIGLVVIFCMGLFAMQVGFSTLNQSNPAHAGLVEEVMSIGKDIYDLIPKDLYKPLKIGEAPEIYGPTKINAQLGNQGLSVAVSQEGTITVFRWPTPSYFDQIKYHTTDRDKKPYWGADPNAGAFLGLSVKTSNGREMVWLRNLQHEQSYTHEYSDVVKTTYTSDRLGLTVTVTDLVPINKNVTADESGDLGTADEYGGINGDALIRNVQVKKESTSPVQSAKLISFENFSLVVSKNPLVPTSDWAQEIQNTDSARYNANYDAVVHTKSGHDLSQMFEPTSVATAMAFAESSDGHEVHGDRYIGNSSPDGAYDGANQNGHLSGNDSFQGQTTGALSKELNLSDGEASAKVIFAAAKNKNNVLNTLSEARNLNFSYARNQKLAWFKDLVGDAPMPSTANESILKLSKRALVTLVQNYDPNSGGIVASIATQSPYAEDWPRDGAYFNYVLDHKLGLHEWVEKHNKWYASIQHDDWWNPIRPTGTWGMNYYTDGAVGGIVPWEIDEVAYTVWTFWDHYRATGDKQYLKDIYPSLAQAAHFLRKYEEPCAWWKWGNCANLPKKAPEDDHIQPSQTIWGAGTTYMAMDAAYKAAKALDKSSDASKFKNRREELDKAINRELWDSSKNVWGKKHPGMPEMVWPIEFRPTYNDRMQDHLKTQWNKIKGTFNQPSAGSDDARKLTADGEPMGLYETKTLLSAAKSWKYSWKIYRVRDGLRWIAEKWATQDTHIMGEVWMVENGDVVTTVSQPHAWEQVLFYMAAVEAYPDYSYWYYY